jgi:formylglycine-generating enzyme required for sulfatase activity
MSHVFISYSKRNRVYARQLAERLLELGFDVWIDDRIDYGENWEREIFKAIDGCSAFVVIMTPEAYESDWVLRECQYADRRKKPPLPILLEGEEFPRYGINQYFDVRGGGLPDGSFFQRLARHAPRKSTRGTEILSESAVAQRETGEPAAYTFPNGSGPKPSVLKFEPPDLATVLPQPFAWCEVPDGYVMLTDASQWGGTKGGKYRVEAFAISKYPITNAQFELFVRAPDGYRDPQWWNFSKYASGWRQQNTQVSRTRLVGPELPRTEISWYEAVAFCRWLGARVKLEPYPFPSGDAVMDSALLRRAGAKVVITLPSEQQWQRAAQGDERRAYPWGDLFDAARCNTAESGIGQLSAVMTYPGGASPYGVMDLAGNVWEWCLTEWGSERPNPASNKLRVVRGGSFFVDSGSARADARSGSAPDNGLFNRGFRIVCAFAAPRA